jgi:transcriptional regulator
MLQGLTAFNIHISDIECTRKFSQNKSDSEKEKIVDHLGNSDDYWARDLAAWMKKE